MMRALGQYEELKKEIDSMDHFGTALRSKRVWVNIVGLIVTLSGIMPAKAGAIAMAVSTVITKLIDMGIFTKDGQ